MPESRPVSMTATFSLALNTSLNARQAVVAKFDGEHPCLAVGTSANPVAHPALWILL